MIKALIFFAVLLAIAFGGAWLADRPGEIIINWPWLDMGFEVSLLMGFLLIVRGNGNCRGLVDRCSQHLEFTALGYRIFLFPSS